MAALQDKQEIKTMYNSNLSLDIIDEIALEGLDGITITLLFERLRSRSDFGLKIDEHSRKYIWEIVRKLKIVSFFQLPKERENIIIPNNLNDENLLALATMECKVYPFHSISNGNECGSCSDYNERINVTDSVRQLILAEAQDKWGSQLVIVANFTCRLKALWGDMLSPDSLEMAQTRPVDHAYLEMIGRSRQRGVPTTVLCKDPKTAFYRGKMLLDRGVIKKFNSVNGVMLILTRFGSCCEVFHADTRGYRHITLTAVKKAKMNSKGLILRDDIYSKLLPNHKKKKLLTSDVFKKYFRVVNNVFYREFHPHAPESEYLTKNKSEKRLSCFQLKDVEESKEVIEEEDTEEEDNSDLSQQDLFLNVSFENQLYREILKAGSVGVSLRDLLKKFSVNNKTINSAVSRLQLAKMTTTYPLSRGRQTVLMNIICKNAETKAAIQRLQERFVPVEDHSKAIDSKAEIPILDTNETDSQDVRHVSARKTFRIGFILRAIKENRIMAFSQLCNLIVQEEKQQNMQGMMDRRSLHRILEQMVKDGLIKSREDRKYCDLSYDPAQETEENLSVDRYVQNILADAEKLYVELTPKPETVKKAEKKTRSPLRTTTPKFLRLSILHDIMFYLVRDYTGDTTSSHEELLTRLEKKFPVEDDVKKEMPRLYLDSVSCYMFTPPLSSLHEKAPGWCGLLEVVMIAPLSSVYAIISNRAMTAEMSYYINHPIRQHYPVSALPLHLRQHFLSQKTLYYISCDVRRLCFMGLIKLGMRSNRKLIGYAMYVNQKASIVDTTSSAIGYAEVEKNREYPTKPYFFRTLHDAKRYWIDLFNVCHQTRLGVGRIGREPLDKGREFDQELLIPALAVVTNDEAVARDDGSIPGDHLGAGGLHSSMYSFIFSNWMAEKKVAKKKMKKLKPARKVLMKKRSVKTVRSQQLDETDREALMQTNRMRVCWSAAEDAILAMCKAGVSLLSRNVRAKIRVKTADLREALRRHVGSESLDKTQLAINRRMIYMSRLDRWPSLRLIIQMTRTLPEVDRMLSPFVSISEVKPNSQEAKTVQAKLSQTFHELLDFLVNRYVENGMIVPMQEMTLPDTIQEFREIYDFSEKTTKLTLNRIKEASIRAVVLSSLASAADKTSLVAQLLQVYRQFDEPLLRTSVRNLHRQSVIATQRGHEPKKKIFLLGNASYHFSQRFTQLLNTKFSQSVYHSAYAELNRLLCYSNDSPIEMNLVSCGPAVFPLVASGHVTLNTSIPEQFVVLDTNLFPAESSSKIMRRYSELMSQLNPNSGLSMDEPVMAKRVKLEPKDDQMDVDWEGDDLGDTVQKYIEAPVGINSARIALLILREIAVREVEPTRSIRKPIDMCVVSTSKVFIQPNHGDLVKEYGVSDGKLVKSILQTIHNRSNFLLHTLDEQQTLQVLMTQNRDSENLVNLFNVISSAGPKGSTRKELRNFGPDAATLVRKLENAGLVLRTGVDDLRFVSRQNATIWSIKSYKLTRLEREKMNPKAFVAPLTLDSVYGQPSTSRDDSPFSESKAIQVIMRPWVRVDGSINRRVLDRMLGSVLGFILCHPGIQCSAVIAKFSPAFSLVWIRELIDLLELLGCVKQITCRINKPTLFSKGGIELMESPVGLEEDDEILIEPKLDATVRLGQFIGNKSYLKDMFA